MKRTSIKKKDKPKLKSLCVSNNVDQEKKAIKQSVKKIFTQYKQVMINLSK